ncbi:MAG: VWA domain-containing protein [Acidimicrobiales bacterium]
MSEFSEPVGFPFVAVVGLDDVKLALLIGAVEPRLGGVLLRGEKGSAKTTLARGLAALLPGDPPPPFVDLPIGATEDRVVGTLDLSEVLRSGDRKLHPGLLSAAHGGLLYVDEVNLLPDHLVDVLLDVAQSGVNRVERDGVSVGHESRFFLVGSMNPEEGELRPQLLDRFGLAVDVASSLDPSERSEAVRRRLAFDADPAGFAASWADATEKLAARLAACEVASVPPPVVEVAARMAVLLGAHGLRADLSLCRAAAAFAGLSGRSETVVSDVREVAALALSHRRRRGPFDPHGVSAEELDEAFAAAVTETPSPGPRPDTPGSGEAAESAGGGLPDAGAPDKGDTGPAGDLAGDGPDVTQPGAAESSPASPASPPPPPSSAEASLGVLSIPLPVSGRRKAGPQAGTTDSRGQARGHRPSGDRLPSGTGRAISSQVAGPGARRIAVIPTALAMAARHESAASGTQAEGSATGALGAGRVVETSDLHEVIAEQRLAHLIVLCVDASGSMGAEQRAAAARGAVLRLLTDAYQRRDRVAVVSFSGDGASVVLRPTGSIEVARARLADLHTGGRTPLAEAIVVALEVCLAPANGGYSPILAVVSDGRATSAPAGLDPVEAALDASDRVAKAGVASLVIDVETSATPLRLGATLARRMGARYVRLDAPTDEGIDQAVRSLLVEPPA